MELVRLPVLPIKTRNAFVFPLTSRAIEIGRPESAAAVRAAQEQFGGRLVIAYQIDPSAQEAKSAQLYKCAVKARLNRVEDLSGGGSSRVRAHVAGLARISLEKIEHKHGMVFGLFSPVAEAKVEFTEHLQKLAVMLQGLTMSLRDVSFRPMQEPKSSSELSAFIDKLSFYAPLPIKEKVGLLNLPDAGKRAELLHTLLRRAEDEQEVQEFEADPPPKPPIGGGPRKPADPKSAEIERLRQAIEKAGMTDEAKRVADSELRRLQVMRADMADFGVTMNYLETLVSLPWNRLSEDKIDVAEAKRVLDADHYGLKKPKSRILEFLAVRKLAPERKGMILCLSGPPGVGKTSLGKSIAKAMNREFVRLSLGGVSDEAEIRGHRRTYIGALPGKIVQEIRKAGVRNPVFMLDELDKVGRYGRGDVSASLLEVLDPEQNKSFVDNYVAVGFDLSQVMFIATVNDKSQLHPALRDRMDIVDIAGYSPFDKLRIARHYLVPKQKEESGLADIEISVTDAALEKIISEYTSEAGVRSLERECGRLMRKFAVEVSMGGQVPEVIDVPAARKALGPPRIHAEKMADRPQAGVATGLAWTPHGGSILFLETIKTSKRGGKVSITGNLGDVMKESARLAKAWVLSNADDFGIDRQQAERASIHIHVPSGATPKDGPSAGVALTGSLVSVLSGRPVRNDLAVTGEISLRGKVLPVGGIREKILAAHRAGIREVALPKDNRHDLSEVPKEAIQEMRVHLLDDLKDAVRLMLADGMASDFAGGAAPTGGTEAAMKPKD